MTGFAIISPCGQFRYRLERDTSTCGGITAVIMVNPSTADATQDDATIRKARAALKAKPTPKSGAEQ